jgi:serine/threonine protein kinase
VTDEAHFENALRPNSMLLEYRLESVLGVGGFGMTYLGWDTNLEKHVAIKEFFPGDLAVRALDGSIVPVNTESEFNYKWGLDRFIKEARTLARFSHPNIVRVNRFFEANGTSYMVMDYEAGESLQQHLKRVPMPDEAALKTIMMPLLDGLEAIHQAGFLHRDIKPSNVFLRTNGVPLLIDFGSARLATGAVSKSMRSMVSPGYAPLEQYMRDGNQGPWSDIYALSGVLYRAVTGEHPPDAVRRMRSDVVPAALAGARLRYDERFLRAIEWGLKLNEKVRPRSIAEWRELFSGRVPMSALNRGGVEEIPGGGTPGHRAPRLTRVNATHKNWVRGVLVIAALAVALGWWSRQRETQRESRLPAPASAEISSNAAQPFEAADADHNGSLTRSEMRERLPHFASRFDEMDLDKNGVVSLRELEQFLEADKVSSESRQADAKAPESGPPAAGSSPSPPVVPGAAPPR